MKELTLNDKISELHGIGKTRAEAFSRLGILTVRDLLYHAPRAYENRGKITAVSDGEDGVTGAFSLVVANTPYTARLRRGMTVTKFRAFDATGTVEIVYFNQPYASARFTVGSEYRFFGKLTAGKKHFTLTNPAAEEIRPDLPLPEMVARYPLSEGLSSKIVASAVHEALAALSGAKDFLPENIRLKYELPTLATALRSLHEPLTQEELKRALDRIAFDEYLAFSIGLAMARRTAETGRAPLFKKQNISPLLALLPYKLTEAQKGAVREIAADMAREDGRPMSRILVGDVGCGKTVCAAIAAYIAILNGHQAAIMAPTEILARQHYSDLLHLFGQLGIRVELLLGSTSQKEKSRIYASLLKEGDERTDLLIGTHALLNEKLAFADLGLAVTDEQHRFGVGQRSAIRERNPNTHLLVMSATPIPRTLALVLYGDLDVSRIEEMPAGRQRVDTFLVGEDKRDRLNSFIRRAVSEGGQVYIVCPAIEEDEDEGAVPLGRVFLPEDAEKPPVKAAVEYAKMMATVFPEYAVAYLHGKMKPAEKDEVMSRFVSGGIDILVSTTVIEVGVNVPNASLMVVENAERFGLSQLHQLRGRVGRGDRKSYCILVSDAKGELTRRRLTALTTTYDGYAIAEEDLSLRGPGDFFSGSDDGTIRQSGGLRFSRTAAAADPRILSSAALEASRILSLDPGLTAPENLPLAEEVERLFHPRTNTFS